MEYSVRKTKWDEVIEEIKSVIEIKVKSIISTYKDSATTTVDILMRKQNDNKENIESIVISQGSIVEEVKQESEVVEDLLTFQEKPKEASRVIKMIAGSIDNSQKNKQGHKIIRRSFI